MSIRIRHEGRNAGPPYERCCFCRIPTPYWYDTKDIEYDVAICLHCSSRHRVSDIPTKEEWCEKERLLPMFEKSTCSKCLNHVKSILKMQYVYITNSTPNDEMRYEVKCFHCNYIVISNTLNNAMKDWINKK